MTKKQILINRLMLGGLIIFSTYHLPLTRKAYSQEPKQETTQQQPQTETKSEGQPAAVKRLVASQNVTFDFKDADIRNVLKIVSYKAGVNIVATPEVIGNVTIRLVDVPWEKALDTIVKTYGFGYEWLSDEVIMVSTLERLAKQRKAQQEAAEIEPLDTKTFVLNFSKAQDIKASMEKLVSPKGKVTLETHTNTLIITDTKSNLMRIGEIIKELDKITPQVIIEAKIIETSLGNAEKIGIDWTMKVTAKGSKRPTTMPFEPKGEEKWMKNVFPPASSSDTDFLSAKPYALPFPVADYDKGALRGDFTFGTLDFTQFQAVLEILKSRSDTKTLSNPRITTINNQEAEMFVGSIVPIPIYDYTTQTGAITIKGYEDKKVGIRLTVTPNINEQNYITLNIKPSVDEITGWTGPNNERPIIASRSAETRVMIKDGQTLVMGGLISEKKIRSKKGFPILKDIPILDFVFAKREDTLDKTELLIFITPRIVKEGGLTPEEIAKLEKELGKPKK